MENTGVKHLTYFKVENFKRLDSFEMENIGQFNLIVGDNNVGKTTILESLLINENIDEYLYRLDYALTNRNIKSADVYSINDFFLTYYFNKHSSRVGINFTYKYTTNRTFSIEVYPTLASLLNESEFESIKNELILNSSRELVKFNINGTKGFVLPSNIIEENVPLNSNNSFLESVEDNYSKNVLISSSLKKQFLKDLSVFIVDVEDIDISKINNEYDIVIWTKNNDKPIPLMLYGDGTVRLFRILLQIIIFQKHKLMIDEIDTGIHHSRFKKFLKTILLAAKRNNVQLFATTHSKECLQYFKEVLEEEEMKELQKDTRCISLIESDNNVVKSFTYDFDRFQFAIEQENELR